MAIYGPYSPTVSAVEGSVGTINWVDGDNAFSSNDAYATTEVPALQNGEVSKYLLLTGFGAAVQSAESSSLITVRVERSIADGMSSPPLDSVADHSIVLFSGGAVIATGTPSPDYWSTSDEIVTYTFTDLLSAATLNDSTFGVGISAASFSNGGSVTALIDHVTVTINAAFGDASVI